MRSESNIWLEQRLAQVRSMRLEISALEARGDGTAVVCGPGVCGPLAVRVREGGGRSGGGMVGPG